MQTNILYDLECNVESEVKRAESEIENKKTFALSKIVTTIETANSVKEIIKFEKQYDEAEKKFNQEIILQREKATKNFIYELNRLIKHLKKDCVKNKDNNFKKVKSRCKK